MPNVYFATDPFEARELIGNDRDAFRAFCEDNSARNFRVIHRNSAYCLNAHGPAERSAVQQIASLPARNRERLAACTREFGDDLHAISEFVDRNLRPLYGTPVALAGAGANAANTRLTNFQRALLQYQEALLDLRGFENRGVNRYQQSRGAGQVRSQLESAVRDAYEELDQRFRAEMDRAAPRALRHKNRGNALSNAERGITLAHRNAGRKPDPRLFVADSMDAGKLGRLSAMTHGASRGITAVDAGFRMNRVADAYQDDDTDWRETATKEATSFAVATTMSGASGKVTASALAKGAVVLGFSVTPAGWAGIIVGATVVGLGAGYVSDNYARNLAQRFWGWVSNS